MSKKFSRTMALLLSLLMILSVSPVSFMAAYANEDESDAPSLSFTVLYDGEAAQGAGIKLYSEYTDSPVNSGIADSSGKVSFDGADASQITKAAVSYNGETYNYYEIHSGMNTVNFDKLSKLVPNKISVSEEISIKYGETKRLSANAENPDNTTLKYYPIETGVIEIDSSGNITPLKAGKTPVLIYAPYVGNDYDDAYKTVQIYVEPSDKAITGFEKGDMANAETGTVIKNPAVLEAGAVGTVTYESSEPKFAEVDDEGTVTIIMGGGESTITATFTPDKGCENYTESTLSYTVSSAYVVTYDKDGEWTNEGVISFSGAEDGAVTFSVDNGDEHYRVSGNEIRVSATAEIPDGQHTVTVHIESYADPSVPYADYTFTVLKDTEEAEVKVNNSNSEEDWLRDDDIKDIIVSFSDAASGIASVKYTYSYADGTSVAKEKTDSQDVVIRHTDLKEGENKISFTVTDKAGNEAQKTITVKKDSEAPVVAAQCDGKDWDNASWFCNKDFSLDILFDKDAADGSASPIAEASYTLNGGSESKDWTLDKDNDNHYIIDVNDLKLESGKNTLSISAKDEAGNEAAQDFILNYDPDAPAMTATLSYEEDWINSLDEKSLNVTGIGDSLSGIASVSYIFNGETVDISEKATWDFNKTSASVSIPLVNIKDGENKGIVNGENLITVAVTDAAGNTATQNITVKYDTEKPLVGCFSFKTVGESSAEEIGNALTFGKFFNKGLKVIAQVEDSLSGVDKENITLTLTQSGTDTVIYVQCDSLDKEGNAVFIAENSSFNLSDGETFLGTAAVTVVDNAGNDIFVSATTENSDTIGTIMCEMNAPKADIDAGTPCFTDSEGNEWYDEPEVSVKLSDNDSGVREYKITVNDDEEHAISFAANGIDELFDSKDAQVDFGEINPDENGRYTIKAEVTDAAGNKRTETKDIYVDASAPVITSFTFEVGEKQYSQDEFKSDGEYGYYFPNDTKVTITASDTGINDENYPSAGLKNIELSLKNAENEDATDEYASEYEYGDGSVSFIVKAGFKGNIYAKVSDNVNRYSEEVTPDSIVIETQESHDNASDEHISMALEDYSDNCRFKDSVSPVITVSDIFAGIKSVEISVTGDDIKNNYDETLTVENGTDGWDILSEEENLVTSMSKTLTIDENCGNIVISVSMEDNCGNTSQKEYSFGIDKTLPTVQTEFDNGESVMLEDGSDYWFNGGRTLNFSVTERELNSVTLNIKRTDGEGETTDTGIPFTVSQEGSAANKDDTVYSASYAFNEDGKYEISYTVSDEAGNTVSSSEPFTFGIDKSAPTISNIKINGTNLNKYIDDGYITIGADGAGAVKVKLDDGEGCGADRILYYTVDENGDMSDEQEATADESGVASFSLPAEFKGDLCITTYDKLDNSCTVNVTLWTQEDSDVHDANAVLDIIGVESGRYYNEDKTATVKIYDPAGISRVTWTIKNGSMTEQVDASGEALAAYDWVVSSEDVTLVTGEKASVVTSAEQSFDIKGNHNDITVTVTYVDLAGNSKEKTVTFNIDETKPVTDFNLPEAAWTDSESVSYFSGETIVELNATERNFKQFNVSVKKDGEEYAHFNLSQTQATEGTSENKDDTVTASSIRFIEEGYYEITASAEDEAGNVGDEKSVTFSIDKTAPAITAVEFRENEETTLEKLVNIFTFGIFSDKDVYAYFTAEDNGTKPSGIKKYKVKIGSTVYESAENSDYVVIPYEEARVSPEYVLVASEDNVGNGSDNYALVISDSITTNAYPGAGSLILLEKNEPEIEINIPEFDINGSASYLEKTDDGEKLWFKSDAQIAVNVSDNDSGIRQAVVSVNDNELVNIYSPSESEQNQKKSDIITVNTKDAERGADGKYNIAVTVTDNAGNTHTDFAVIYKDAQAPAVTGMTFELSDPKDSPIKSVLNLLKFGTFANDSVKLTVEADDDGEDNTEPSSGIAYYTLYIDNVQYKADEINTSGEFIIDYEDYSQAKRIAVTVTDNAGNTCEKTSPTNSGTSSNASNDYILMEKDGASITVSMNTEKNTISTDDDGRIWFAGDVYFDVAVNDTVSGINSVKMLINDEEVYSFVESGESAEKTEDIAATVSNLTDDGAISTKKEMIGDAEYEAYTLTVQVVDNAGNASERSMTVYLENGAPIIDSIDISAGELSGWQAALNLLTFGTFFNNNVTVTVKAHDNYPSSGFNGIEAQDAYMLTIGTGENAYTYTPDSVALDEDSESNAKTVTLVFTIPAKEYTEEREISVTVKDSAGNAVTKAPSETSTNAGSDMIMLEQTTPGIAISVPADDSEGVRMYEDESGRKWYSGDVAFTVDVNDTQSGIRSVSATINGTSVLDESYNALEAKTTEKSYSLRTDAEGVERNSDGSYTLSVTVTDNAGNTYTDSKVIYKDTDAPVVTEIKISGGEGVSGWKKALNLLSFGIFFNDDVKVTVSATDDNAPASGINSYTLYVGSNEYASNNTGVFTIEYREYDPAQEISVIVTDNVDNTCEKVTPTSVTTNAKNNFIMLEQTTPGIAISVPADDLDGVRMYEAGGNKWYSGDVAFTVDVNDTQSGIRSVSAAINGTSVLDESYNALEAKTTEKSYSLRTDADNVEIAEDGSYTLNVTVVDNAGNTHTDSAVIYKDMDAPVITGIDISGDAEKGWEDTLNLLTFGTFFNNDVTVTVSAEDNLSGFEAVLGTDDYILNIGDKSYAPDSIKAEYDTVNNTQTIECVFTVAKEEYTSEKEFSVTFKDAVDNAVTTAPSETSTNAGSDMIMLEQTTPAIAISVPSDDPNGVRMYESDGKKWYSGDIDFTVNAKDGQSGIRSVSATINGTSVLDEAYNALGTKTTEKSYSLRTDAEGVEIAADGSYTLNVTVVDNAGNTYSDSAVIYKDTDAPDVTEIKISGGEGVSGWKKALNLLSFGIFFNDDVKVTVSATDDNAPASGINSYTLYVGENMYASNDTGVFTIEYKEYDPAQEISVTVTDNVDNTCEKVTPTSVETNAGSDMIMLEQTTPAIAISVPADDPDGVRMYEAGGNKWYSGDIEFEVDASDTQSGIRSVSAEINGTVVLDEAYNTLEEKTHEKLYSLSTAAEGVERNSDGSYILNVTVVDNAGNTYSDSAVVYKDIDAPVVAAIAVTGDESAGWKDALNLLSFGIFFNHSVTVTVTASDNSPASGVKTYTLYLDDNEYASNETGIFAIDYTEYVPAKEISVTVTDNVKNTCEKITPTGVSSNAKNDFIMLEQTTPAIAISVPSDDPNGVRMYESDGKKWYSGDVAFNVDAKDEQSGIRSVSASINGVSVLNEEYSALDAKTTEKSYSLLTASSGVKRNSDGSYTLNVTVVDNAGNTYSDSAVIYKDTSSPVVTEIKISGDEEKGWQDALNLLTFGIFFNHDVTVTASASDNSPASGVKTYTLYLDDNAYASNETGVFAIDYTEYVPAKEVSVTVTDNVGNTCAKVTPTGVTTNAANDSVMLEQTTPAIAISVPGDDPNGVRMYESDGKKWYSGDIDFTVNAKDEQSGIRSVSAEINGTSVLDEAYNALGTKTTEKSYSLSTGTKGVERNSDGSFTLKVTVVDNAGNTYSDSAVIYKGTTAPVVTEINISGDEEKGWQDALNMLTFGIFFNHDVTIKVKAENRAENSSGIKTYTLYLDDDIYASNDTGIFTIEYKEYDPAKEISVTATDNVGNTSVRTTPSMVKSAPSDWIMLEQTTPAIAISVPGDDPNGVRMYESDGKIWYSNDIDFAVNVKDEQSGIRSVSATINNTRVCEESFNSADLENSVSLDVSGNMDVSGEELNIDEASVSVSGKQTEKNYSLSTKGIPAKSDGSYELKVTVTDNAGNTYTDSKVIYMDTMAPEVSEIIISGDEEKGWQDALNLLTFGIFFNHDVTVTVSASDNSPASGIKSYSLYLDGEEDDNNDTGEFTIDYARYNSAKEITVTVTDNVNNKCEPVTPTSVSTNAKNDNIMLERDNSVIIISLPEDGVNGVSKINADGKIWYSKDISFDVEVEDAQSGIRSVTAKINGVQVLDKDYSVNDKKTTNVSYSFSTATNGVVSKANGSYLLEVDVVDNAGNTHSDKSEVFIEDSVHHNNEKESHISLSFTDGTSYASGAYYNRSLEPKITIRDSYAGINEVKVVVTDENKSYNQTITLDNGSWEYSRNDNGNISSASVTILMTADSNDINIAVTMKDNASNVSTAEYTFNIDKTLPVISCELSSSAKPLNGYYSADVTATITVVDHNFEAANVSMSDGTALAWSSVGSDTYRASVTYSGEEKHNFTIDVTDKAGNRARNSGSNGDFYVDHTDPTITVTDMKNGQMNNSSDDISFTIMANDNLMLSSSPFSNVKFTVWYKEKDEATDSYVIKSFTGDLKELENLGFISAKETGSEASEKFGYTITLLSKSGIDNDGIYSFVCSVSDMSGRTSDTILWTNSDGTSGSGSSFGYSLNRHGSTYKVYWSDSGKAVNGTLNKAPGNIIIEETNPNEIQSDSVGTKMTIYDGVDTTDVDVVPVKNDAQTYLKYTYEVPNDNFGKDGYYTLNIETADASGNVSDGADKNNCSVSFTVDATAPVIKTDLESYGSYKASSYDFTISLDDLTDCTLSVSDSDGNYYDVKLANGATKTADNLSLTGAVKTVTLTLDGSRRDVVITAKDALGNTAEEMRFTNITISLNSLNLLISNIRKTLTEKPWIWAIIAAVVVIIILFAVFFAKRKKKDDNGKKDNTKEQGTKGKKKK